jgi:hypothetical protein
MGDRKRQGPDWIEINPSVWINLRRASVIRLHGGLQVEIDGERYNVQQSVLNALTRWLGQREMSSN